MTKKLGMDDHVARSREPVFTEVDGEIMMLSVSSGRYHQVGPVGTAIWKLIEVPCSVRSICGRLEDRFHVDEETCRADVLTFLHELLENDLLQVHAMADPYPE